MISAILGAVMPAVGDLAGKFFGDAEQRERFEHELRARLLEHQADIEKAAYDVVKAEVQGAGIKSWWRPITMLTFLSLIVAWWFGFTPERADTALMQELFGIVKIGIGGYIGGRSVEKVAPEVRKAMEAMKR